MRKVFLIALLAFYAYGKTNLLFYCGITMVPAVLEAKTKFEKAHNCKINIVQGGSKDLYKSIQSSSKGDLYLPGKISYLDKCAEKGQIAYRRFVGYNRLVIFVKKGNPKHISSIGDLLRSDLISVLGNPDTCSIGKMADDTLIRYAGKDFYDKVKYNLGLYAVDSRDMNKILISGEADVGLSWTASLYNKMLRSAISIVPISDLYAPPQKLEIGVLSFSVNKKFARDFVDFLSSEEGRKIMQKYGFSDHE